VKEVQSVGTIDPRNKDSNGNNSKHEIKGDLDAEGEEKKEDKDGKENTTERTSEKRRVGSKGKGAQNRRETKAEILVFDRPRKIADRILRGTSIAPTAASKRTVLPPPIPKAFVCLTGTKDRPLHAVSSCCLVIDLFFIVVIVVMFVFFVMTVIDVDRRFFSVNWIVWWRRDVHISCRLFLFQQERLFFSPPFSALFFSITLFDSISRFLSDLIVSFIHSFVHSFIHSAIHSFIHSFCNSFILQFIHSFILQFIHPFDHSFGCSPKLRC